MSLFDKANARMAELVDALVSGASAERCRSSNLLSGTNYLQEPNAYEDRSGRNYDGICYSQVI